MVFFLCQFCVFLAMDSLTATSIFLQAWFYASTLIPLTILALGSLIGRVVESLDGRRFRVCFGLSALSSFSADGNSSRLYFSEPCNRTAVTTVADVRVFVAPPADICK